jgi:adenylate kinase family enzyme
MKRNLKRKGYFGNKKRADDSLAALKIRRNFAQANLVKSQPIYKSLYPFKKISGMGTVAEVTARVGKTVESLLAQV